MDGAAPVVAEHAVAVSDKARRVTLVERTVRPESGRPDLGSASVVVAGGRGTEGDFSLVEELADVHRRRRRRDARGDGRGLDRARRADRPDRRDHRAELYVGVGVSGAVHHRGGMQASGTIVAINSDPDAPIFEIADFGVVGDLFTVLPQAVAEIRRLKG